MIAVTCALCGQIFEVDDDCGGRSETCPNCGALNDIPMTDAVMTDAVVAQFTPLERPSRRNRGRFFWRLAVFVLIAGFVVAAHALLAGDWEQDHIQAISDANNRAQADLLDGDYSGAAGQFQSILDLVGDRSIQSEVLREVVQHARDGVAYAKSRETIAAATSRAAATEPVVVVEQPDEAILRLQRTANGFSQFVAKEPMVFQDDQSKWRRRQLMVSEVLTNAEPQTDPPKLGLKYTFSSRVTIAHDSEAEAQADIDFADMELLAAVHCQSEYVWQDGKWRISDRSDDHVEKNSIRGEEVLLTDVRTMEDELFLGPQTQP
jgi:hypothetical protein